MTDKRLDPTSNAYLEGVDGQPSQSMYLGTVRVWGVQGVPSAALGGNGDFALRSDGAAGANTTIYHKESGAWVGLTA
jgi:hypothetical protein